MTAVGSKLPAMYANFSTVPAWKLFLHACIYNASLVSQRPTVLIDTIKKETYKLYKIVVVSNTSLFLYL